MIMNDINNNSIKHVLTNAKLDFDFNPEDDDDYCYYCYPNNNPEILKSLLYSEDIPSHVINEVLDLSHIRYLYIDCIILLLHLMSIPLSSVFGMLASRPIQE